jgi:death-on-curing protein
LLAGIVQNHPFLEGNKRTALVAARTLLINNGYDIGVPDQQLGPEIRDLAAGHLAEADLIDTLERHLIDAPD